MTHPEDLKQNMVMTPENFPRLIRQSIIPTKRKILFLLVIPLLLYMMLLPVIPLTEPDEARYSDIPSLMNHSGDYVTPRLNHVVYLEKPPLAYWATAFFFKVLGESEFTSRLFSGLCAWGCILLVYAMGVFLYDEKTGLYSAAVLSTFLYPFILGRLNLLDMPLTFLVGLAIWAGFRFFAGNCQRRRWIYLFYFSSALAFLTKGLVGILLPFAITGIWLATQKRWRDMLKLIDLPGIGLFLAVTSPWIILVQKANSNFLHYFFISQHFLRYTTDAHGRVTMFYYLPVIVLGTVPWLSFFIPILWRSTQRALILQTFKHSLLLSWMIFILVFFSISSSKMPTYISPVFLPVAIVFGRAFKLYEEEETSSEKGECRGFLRQLPMVIQSLIFLVLLLLPPFLKEYPVPLGEWWPWVTLPILVLMLTVFLTDLAHKRWRRSWFLTLYLLSAIFLGSIVFPLSRYLTPHKSSLPVAQAIKEFIPAGEELYQYRIYLRGINFYCKIRTPIVGRPDEIATGRDLLPPAEKAYYFLSVDKFYHVLREKGEL
jgi:hypothetical protein